MDTLSDVLSLLELRHYMAGGFDMGADLSIQFPKHERIKCYALVSGTCWLIVGDGYEKVPHQAGDRFILPRGLPFRMASDPDSKPVDFRELLPAGRKNGGISMIGGGGGFFIVGGHFALNGRHADVLLGSLPTIVHIRDESEKAALRWSLERMMEELREPQPGGILVTQYLASMILIQALRLHLGAGLAGCLPFLISRCARQ